MGGFIKQTGNFGIFLYGSLERLLIPTGLHYLVYTPFLYTSLGGTEQIAGHIYEGARNIYYAEMADPAIHLLSKSVIWDARGISKMFGLIGKSDKAGSGVDKIFKGWRSAKWRQPFIEEHSRPDNVKLYLPMESLISDPILNALRENFGQQIDSLAPNEIIIFF